MIVAECKTCFFTSSRYSISSIVTKSRKMWKFVKRLDTMFQLATSQMVLLGALFKSLVDHVKITEAIP